MPDLINSKTKENLLRAFAGESQARNRYTFAAQQANDAKVYVIEKVFKFTADQEKEHAEIYYNFLSPLSGANIDITAAYPVDKAEKLFQLLRKSARNEYEEFDPVYPDFAKVAREEGFNNIGLTFELISKIEKTHGQRFDYFAQLIEDGMLFESEAETEWLCLNCGHVHRGKEAPKICPVCSNIQSYFIRTELAPFTSSQYN